MSKPTKEDVEKWKMWADEYDEKPNFDQLDELFVAYLAQGEELEAARNALLKEGIKVGELEAETQTLKAQVAELSGYLMRLVNENADHQLEIHKLKNTLAANHIQMNSRQDELVPLDRSLEFGWHRYWLTRTYFEQAAKDANEMARLVQANIRELFEHDGMVGWDELPEWKYAQTIIDRYKNPMAVASGSGRRGKCTTLRWMG